MFIVFFKKKPPINLGQKQNDTHWNWISLQNEVIKRRSNNNNDDLKRATHKIKDFQWIAAALFASHKNHCSEETEEHQTDSQRKYWKKEWEAAANGNNSRGKKSYKINNIGIICLYICCDSWWLSLQTSTYDPARQQAFKKRPSSLYNVMYIVYTIRCACLFFLLFPWMCGSISFRRGKREKRQ